ncbi:hypothetical protein [Cryptosporangium arvum]|uniref:META domain-containing protein n=1 Tax=Cryptosporangium arvum DSM 44712 TaxID=927661 RepID=A0A011AJG4_9ACTN|nr:hypothetical protein [Cryptosporangium arvum]EXG82156.1 hypothetical protein CryarDRAFT_3300 [Cryptosporangium arvum DSM 44712]
MDPASGGGAAFVEFADDGTRTGSDGCNGQGDRWTVTPTSPLATDGPSALIGCDGAPVGGWLAVTAMAGLSSGVLVLLDPTGAEEGRLRRY